mgnify:CR=1 FL=1
MNVLIPKFEEENPGYKVNAVSHEWADLHDKILVSASSMWRVWTSRGFRSSRK